MFRPIFRQHRQSVRLFSSSQYTQNFAFFLPMAFALGSFSAIWVEKKVSEGLYTHEKNTQNKQKYTSVKRALEKYRCDFICGLDPHEYSLRTAKYTIDCMENFSESLNRDYLLHCKAAESLYRLTNKYAESQIESLVTESLFKQVWRVRLLKWQVRQHFEAYADQPTLEGTLKLMEMTQDLLIRMKGLLHTKCRITEYLNTIADAEMDSGTSRTITYKTSIDFLGQILHQTQAETLLFACLVSPVDRVRYIVNQLQSVLKNTSTLADGDMMQIGVGWCLVELADHLSGVDDTTTERLRKHADTLTNKSFQLLKKKNRQCDTLRMAELARIQWLETFAVIPLEHQKCNYDIIYALDLSKQIYENEDRRFIRTTHHGFFEGLYNKLPSRWSLMRLARTEAKNDAKERMLLSFACDRLCIPRGSQDIKKAVSSNATPEIVEKVKCILTQLDLLC